METDSSDIITVGVLLQKGPNREWHLVTFYSKTMSPIECSYEIHNKELLVIMNGLRTWRAELEGIPVGLEHIKSSRASQARRRFPNHMELFIMGGSPY